MVNKSIEELVVNTHGESTWQEVKRRAGIVEEAFVSNEGYPDEITYRLIGAASEVLATPPDRILHAFGEHWVLHTAKKGYGHMLAAGGATLGEFLANLPHFHDRIALLYPKLQPPSFAVSDRKERSLHLHYRTQRAGLTPFVEGLLSGLGRMFEVEPRVKLLQARSAGASHDEFLVEW